MPVSESLPSLLRHKYLNNGLSQRLITLGTSAFVGLGTLFFGTSASFADIIPDSSTNSVVLFSDCLGLPCTINGGETRGDNLFHSFSEFVIPPGGDAILNTPIPLTFSDVDRIFIRVVGSRTEIDGRFRVDDFFFFNSPDVVFLSPQGIRIGENAQLSYPGHFLFSTAERLDFGGGAVFDATNNDPLLTLSNFENLPVTLQLGNSPGQIDFLNNNPGIRATIDIPQTRHQFAVVGNQIDFDDVEISTPGILTLLSANDNQNLDLNYLSSGIVFSSAIPINTADINLNNSALTTRSLSSSDNAGIIEMLGQELRLRQNSEIRTVTDVAGGDIRLNLTGRLELEAASQISSATNTPSAIAGEISINSSQAQLIQNSQISSSTASTGGNISLDVSGLVELDNQSSITTQAADPVASAGNITISADSLSLLEQNKIETGSNSTDGNIDLTIAGNVNLENSSRISTVSSDPTTSGSNITLNAAGRVLLLDQSTISTQPGADVANLGLIDITAASLDLIQESEISTVAGEIIINSDQIQLERSSEIKSSTDTSGGNINLNVSGPVDLNTLSTITTQATAPTASAGNITISADSLRLLDINKIETASNSTDGNINLMIAGDVLVEDVSQISTSPDVTATNGSNITLNADGNVLLLNQGIVSTQPNTDTANFGLIDISSTNLDLINNSEISTTAGEISVNSDQIQLTQSSEINSSTDTSGGNINLNSSGQLELDSLSKITTQATTPTASAGNITISAGGLSLLDQNVISTQTNSTDGNITLIVSEGNVQIDNSSRIATTAENNAAIAGDISLTSGSLSVTNSGKIISGFNGFTSGTIEIDLSENLDIGSSGEIATVANLLSNPAMGASAGNILVAGENLSIGGAGKLYTLTENLGGDLNLDFSGDISVRDPDSFIAVLSAGSADAGTLDLQASNLILSNQGKIFSGTSQGGGELHLSLGQDVSLNTGSSMASKVNEGSGGSAGDLNLSASNLTIDGNGSILFSLTENGGGNVNLNLTDDITLTNGAQLGAFLTSNGDTINGDTGSLSLQARNLSLNNNADIITETADGHGDIDIDLTGNLSVTGGSLGNSEIITKLSTTKGAAGNISISANNVNFDQGFLLTETDQPGGNINVDAINAIQFDQSLIRLSSPTGTGHTGNLSLESQSSVVPVGILLINTEVFNEATNTGGNVALTAQSEVEMRDGSYISIDSSGVNGDFTVAASAFRSNDLGADNDVLLNQGTLNNLSLPVEVTGFDPLADQVVRANANSELLPNIFPPPVTPPSPPEPQPAPVIPMAPEPQAPLPPVMAPLANNPIVEPLDTPTSRPTPPETNGNAPPPYSEFRYLSSQTENFLTVEDLLAFYGSAQSSSSNFKPRSCLASGPSHFKISGRGGISSSPSSLHGSSQSLVDLGQFDGNAVSDSSTDFSQPMIESSEPSSHWHEAHTWQQNSQGEIELVAQSNWLGTHPQNHRCQSLG